MRFTLNEGERIFKIGEHFVEVTDNKFHNKVYSNDGAITEKR